MSVGEMVRRRSSVEMIQVKSRVSGCGIYDAQSSKEKWLEEGRLLK
jgi:hypothetical protein